MATPTINAYGNMPLNLLKKLFSDWSSASSKLYWTLHTSSYTPSQDNHTTYSDLTNELTTGSGYTAGGLLATGLSVAYATRVTTFTMDNPLWTSPTSLTARIAVLRDGTTSGATNQKLMLWVDFKADYVSAATAYGLSLNGSGLLTFTVPAVS